MAAISPRDAGVQPLLAALTAELAGGGYRADQTFGYSVDQLERSGVHLVAAQLGAAFVGVAGIELQGPDEAELKRFYVRPEHRGAGVADALIAALLEHARAPAGPSSGSRPVTSNWLRCASTAGTVSRRSIDSVRTSTARPRSACNARCDQGSRTKASTCAGRTTLKCRRSTVAT